MTTPQQPELRRSGRGATDPASAKSNAEKVQPNSTIAGPVPPDNQPGHHPDHEQDKPQGPPGSDHIARPGKAVDDGGSNG
jgi:hypothetical protein